MSMSNLAYARLAFQFFSRSARHIYQLIAGHQNPETGWAYLSYACLAKESGLTPRRVMQLVAFLEANHALEVRRGHGRGHINFYRILREEDGLPVPHRSHKKVKSETRPQEEKVKFPTPPAPEKVKSETPNSSESLQNMPDKVVETKEREKKGAPLAPFSLWPERAETKSPFWCEAHRFSHSERLPDQLPGCWCETEGLTATDGCASGRGASPLPPHSSIGVP
jgi:hypothetical protein